MANSKKIHKIGILAFHGDVSEHVEALEKASSTLSKKIEISLVRTKEDLKNLDAIIFAGGESPTLQKLCERAGIWEELRKIKNIFGTCAGAILLAKKVYRKSNNQKTLALMNIEIDRNAYGRQVSSFEKKIKTTLGPIDAVFIRAPKIISVGKNIKVLALDEGEILACEERSQNRFYLATCFHPELSSIQFHQYFLSNLV